MRLQANIEILSFGLGNLNNYLSQNLPIVQHQAGTPIIPITLGGIYDFTGGRAWFNPAVFADFGPAVSLNGETMPLTAGVGIQVTTPLGKLSDALSGVDLFVADSWQYISNISGLADTAVGVDVAPGSSTMANLVSGGNNNAALNYMLLEFGATFVF